MSRLALNGWEPIGAIVSLRTASKRLRILPVKRTSDKMSGIKSLRGLATVLTRYVAARISKGIYTQKKRHQTCLKCSTWHITRSNVPNMRLLLCNRDAHGLRLDTLTLHHVFKKTICACINLFVHSPANAVTFWLCSNHCTHFLLFGVLTGHSCRNFERTPWGIYRIYGFLRGHYFGLWVSFGCLSPCVPWVLTAKWIDGKPRHEGFWSNMTQLNWE